MAKERGGDLQKDVEMGTDNWNSADGYSKLKILRQLILLDRWETIAQFGAEEIDEDQNYDTNRLKKRRVEALERLHATLKQLVGNVLFAMKKEDLPKLRIIQTRVENIEDFIQKTYTIKEDRVTHEDVFEINEKLFKKLLEIMQAIKDQLNTPLNNAGLIFRTSEEIDLDKIMQGIIEGG
jgi:hypothetical protein